MAALYAVRTGALPESRWYVVNQFLADDPDTRRPALAGSGDDLSVFADDGGLLIDTRDLFGLVHLVELGSVTSRQTRTLLRSSRGTLKPAIWRRAVVRDSRGAKRQTPASAGPTVPATACIDYK